MFNGKLISVFQSKPKDTAHQWAATVPARLDDMVTLESIRSSPDQGYPSFAPTAPMGLPRN